MKKHLIIGNPINHSLSPKIHNYWFSKYKIDAIYEKISPKADEIQKIIGGIKEESLFAMNVTVPFKQQVIPFVDLLSSFAKKTNSVNTIYKKNGKVYGDNTDVIGFELAIKNSKISMTNKTALILGAGGVVPSIIVALQNLGIKKIYISNRTEKKIEKIKLNFPTIEQLDWSKVKDCDIFINATSIGLKNEDKIDFDFNKLQPNKFFYDVIYNPPNTNFLEKAKNNGHKTLNGQSMFLYQAQKAFEIWHNILPEINNDLTKFLEND